jgi:hypothetical protein
MLINSIDKIPFSHHATALSSSKSFSLNREKSSLISLQAAPTEPSCLTSIKRALQRFFLFSKGLFSITRGQFTSYDEKRLAQIATKKKFLTFYDQRDPLTYFLGNYYPCKITMDYHNPQTNHREKLVFPNSEALYQSLKFNHHPALVHQLTKVKNGHEAWQLAQNNKDKIRKDWDSVLVMQQAIHAKFTQHPELKKRLLSTQNAYLVEHTARDGFWGDKGDGSGQNRLGRLLMHLRGELGGSPEVSPPKGYAIFLKQQR